MSACLLLTAGLGTRLRPFTEKVPKPCLPFLNLPLMNYSFYLARHGGFEDFVLNLHHLPEQVKATSQKLTPHCQTLSYSDETTQILGSGGALFKAKNLLKNHEHFLVANGDEVLIPSESNLIADLVKKFHSEKALCTLLTCDHPDLLKKFNAVWVNTDGQVREFGKETAESDLRPVHYTGYKIFSRRIFDYLPDGKSNIFYEVLKNAIAQGETVNHHFLETVLWYETGDFDSFISASRDIALCHMNELRSLQGFFKQDLVCHLNLEQEPLVTHSADSALRLKLKWQNFACLGKGTKLKSDLQIKNIISADNATLSTESGLEDSFIF